MGGRYQEGRCVFTTNFGKEKRNILCLSSLANTETHMLLWNNMWSKHADYHLPNKNPMVKHLVDDILCNDAPLQDVIAMVLNYQGSDGMISYFESTSSCLFTYDLVAKRKSSGDARGYAFIYMPNAEVFSSLVALKSFIGKTRVHFRCYKRNELKRRVL